MVVVSGEVFVTTETGEERRLGPGDFAFFPAGSFATWRVTKLLRKVAVLRDPLPRSLTLGLRVWNKLLRLAGVGAIRKLGRSLSPRKLVPEQ